MFQIKDVSRCHKAWYLIHCQPRKERYASHALESQLGLSTFLPEYKTRSQRLVRSVPCFPGYIFIQVDLGQVPLSQINATPGVIRLVAFGDDPQPVPFEVIQMIYERLSQFDLDCKPLFQPGDVVRVKKDGPLQDLEMIFVGPTVSGHRVTVLLNLLGRLKEVYLDVETLEIVTHSPVDGGRDTQKERDKELCVQHNSKLIS